MKRRLTKILFISLLLSAAIPSAAQASFFSLPTLKKIGSKALNLLTTNGGGDIFSFLKRHKIAVGAGAVFVVLWKLKKVIRDKIIQKIDTVMQNRQKKLYRQIKLTNDLTKAIRIGDGNEVKLALKLGADADNKNEYGYTALTLAAREGHLKIAKLLLQYNANVNGKDRYSKTPLIKAAENNHSKVIELLLTNKADPTMKDRFRRTALMEAKHRGNLEAVKSLEDFQINKQNNFYNHIKSTAMNLLFS